ncbi:MAG: sugar phosphate isomerase/epimerase [Cytophagales bacterium]|nr:sugar phosphate isomerase/epimerase [Armatimonadota bacterium]
MTRIPVALQLYSVRGDCARDLPGTLKAVAEMGYEGVEFAGYYQNEAPALKQMLDAVGLKVAGAHVGLETLLGEALEKSIPFHQTLENKFLIVPGLAEQYRTSTEAWRKTAETMNTIAAALAPAGLHTGYHNHTVEFAPFTPGGELPWDTFFGGTTSNVVMQFDTGNAMHGGSDALPFLLRYPNRALTVHLKEYAKDDPNALLGEGDVPFPAILEACETIGGTRWYIVEQESYPQPPLVCAEQCLRNLEKLRG